MEETLKSKRRSKLKKNKVAEDTSKLKECTPVKKIPPQAHSTPLDSEKVPSTSTFIKAEYKNVSEDEEEDQDSSFQFNCTQDTLDVGWDYGSPQQNAGKRLGSKVKRKLSKGNSFAQKKESLKSSLPIEPIRPRRRFNIEKSSNDFSELIPELQVLGDLLKGQNNEETEGSCSESNVANTKKEDLAVKAGECDVDINVMKTRGKVHLNDIQNLKELDLLKNDAGNETFTALFDDDEDEYMVQCSQDIEEKLNKNVSSDNSELPLGDIKTSVDSTNRRSKIGTPGRNSLFNLEHASSSTKKQNSPKVVGTKSYVRIKSGTPKCSRDKPNSHSSRNHSSASSRDSVIINSKPSTANENAFDDSFDAVIQNLTEEDIEMLSQGLDVKKKASVTDTCKQSFQYVEGKTQLSWKRGNVLKSSVEQPTHIHKALGNNQPVHHINNRQVNQRSAANGPNNNKVQFNLKVPSRMCNNPRISNCPSTDSSLELNRPHSNKGIPLLNMNAFVMRQEQANCATKKKRNTVQLGSSATSNPLASNDVLKSSPQKCTPEEIQKKRLEAKKRLEKKQLAMFNKKDKQCQHSKGSMNR